MLVLLPFSMGAQEVDQSVEKRIDSLATEVTTLDKVVQKLSKFNVSLISKDNTNMDRRTLP